MSPLPPTDQMHARSRGARPLRAVRRRHARRRPREARSLAPGVEIETEGWPYEDETGPLNPDAFRAGDPRDHHVHRDRAAAGGGLVIRTGITYLEMERRDGRLVIVRGYHKPIE